MDVRLEVGSETGLNSGFLWVAVGLWTGKIRRTPRRRKGDIFLAIRKIPACGPQP